MLNLTLVFAFIGLCCVLKHLEGKLQNMNFELDLKAPFQVHPSLIQFFEQEVRCEVKPEEEKKVVPSILLPFKMPKPSGKPKIPIHKCCVVFKKGSIVCSECKENIELQFIKQEEDLEGSSKGKEPVLEELIFNIRDGKVLCDICKLKLDMEI